MCKSSICLMLSVFRIAHTGKQEVFFKLCQQQKPSNLTCRPKKASVGSCKDIAIDSFTHKLYIQALTLVPYPNPIHIHML